MSLQNVTSLRLSPRARLTHIQTEKFKTACFCINLLTPFTQDTASKAALLPRVLRRGTASLPDLDAISAVTDNLYGATISAQNGKYGEISNIGFSSVFLDDDIIPGNNQTERVIKLIGEMLLLPSTSGGFLREDYIVNEKANLIESIKSLVNNKSNYALHTLIAKMCEDEPFGVFPDGTEEDVQKITTRELSEFHRGLLDTAQIEFLYCGASPAYKVEAAVKTSFAALLGDVKITEPATLLLTEPKTPQPRYFTEKMDVAQGILTLGFRLGEQMKTPNYPALNVFNAIYGGGVSSKLFANVRERLSLCYYASSSINSIKGVLFAVSGIDFDNREIAEKEILAQLDAMRRGEITPEELKTAQRTIVTGGLSSLDTPAGLINNYYNLLMLKLPLTPEEYFTLHETVTVDEVMEAAKSVKLDSVLFVEKMEGAQ